MKSYKTAIHRKKPSAPLRFLLEKDLIGFPVLDFGCGHGADLKLLSILGSAEGYDPHWKPMPLHGQKFQTVLCTYVLNVLPKDKEKELLLEIENLLLPGGIAYITVRRDIKSEFRTQHGLQRPVFLNLNTVKDRSDYCIYCLTKER